jgi:hypothetical protein
MQLVELIIGHDPLTLGIALVLVLSVLAFGWFEVRRTSRLLSASKHDSDKPQLLTFPCAQLCCVSCRPGRAKHPSKSATGVSAPDWMNAV